MAIDPIRWFKGYADAEVQGDTARFLREAYHRGLTLSRVRRTEHGLSCRIPLEQLGILYAAASRSHVQVRFTGRKGFPFWLQYLRVHPLIPLLAAVCVMLLFYGSTLIFSVEVEAENPITAADEDAVLRLAEEAGLKVGASRRRLDLSEVEDHIKSALPAIYFVEINEQGTHAVIHVAKRTDVPEGLAPRPPGDVIASDDGVIEAVLVNRGTAAVQEGDTVLKGDVLIYGEMAGVPCAADGMVTAKVWETASAAVAYRSSELMPTGKTAHRLGIRLQGGGILWFWGKEEPFPGVTEHHITCYPLLKCRKTGLRVELITDETGELAVSDTLLTPEEAEQEAVRQADLTARAALFAHHDLGTTDIREIRVTEITKDDMSISVQVLLTAVAEIGVYREGTLSEEIEEKEQ